MKISKVSCFLMGSVALIAIVNVAVILNIDSDFKLKLTEIEALANLEDDEEKKGGEQLEIGLCADGVGEFAACKWDFDYEGECNIWDEKDCSSGETPDVLPGDGTDYSECVKYGHFWSSTFCFATCYRCGISTNLCDD